MSTLSDEVMKALHALQVAVANYGGKLEIIRIASPEPAPPDFTVITTAGPIRVEMVP